MHQARKAQVVEIVTSAGDEAQILAALGAIADDRGSRHNRTSPLPFLRNLPGRVV
jgi:hypothetical protein